ncbi:tape measure protein [uncultured Pseudomonas sp.]|uniref:tape measure protein n=1 Tax=uncultured Pseudomonas sp. TaxID=114707 RepID=UPI0025D7EE07|nr:tape measure protein [uncultured Pseudomonas sp.]
MADASLSGRERAEAETVYHQRVRQTLAELRNMRAAIADQGTQAQRAAAAELQRSQAAREGIRAQAAALAQLAREQRASNLEAARQNLGVSRYRDLQAEIGRLRGQYQLLRSSGSLTTQELAVAQRSLTTRVRETQQALRDMNAEQRRGAGALSGIGVVAGLYAAGRGLRGVTNTADQWVEINDRIRQASESQSEHAQGMERLREISDRTYTDMKNNAELYIGSLSVLRDRGFTNADALNLTEALGLGLVASAAKGERAATVIDQINKALQDGELKGDAFNAVIRNTPALADALARSLGVTREQLAGLAKDGELTTDVWVPALISQVDSLGEAVDSMQVTVGDALTRLNNAWEEAIGTADTKPLIRAIEELTKVISDPVVVDNLVALASALVTLAATAAEGGSEFVDLGKRIGFIAANATGSIAELDKIDQQIKDIDRSLAGSGFNRTLAGMWYSKEELQAQRQALVAMRALLVTELTGMSDDQRKIEEERRAESERQNSAARDDYRKYIGELETLRQGQIKAAQDGAKKLVAVEKKATADLQKVRDDRLKIEQRYQEALNGLGGTGEASYGAAQDLKIGARQALANGDVEGAQRQAQAALKMLQDLAAAGENTYGFRGFIQELQQIELAANDLEQSKAEEKLASIRGEMEDLKAQAAELKELPVSVKTDEASVERVRSIIEALVQHFQQTEIVIPVRVAMPETPGAPAATPTVPGFAGGGIARGPGTGTSDSILARISNGEGIINARAVQYYGADLIHQLNNLRTPRFATGGVMGNVPVPSIPSLAPALQQQLEGGVGERIGVDLSFGGDQVIQLEGSRQAVQDFRRLATKFGGSSRRK